MESNILVSIIMPVYNVEKYLEKTLESVKAQSFQNYELIAINDGSTDKSFEILKMYQDRMPQLYIMDQKNSGVSTARNRGIKRATGEYVCFLDADDQLSPDYLEHKSELDAMADKIVYTGPIDAYFGYKLGPLEYRSVRFETETLDKSNFQGNAAVNYTDSETPWTRIIEHKWFEFGKDENGNDLPKTIISREYSSEWKPGDEPYYPVNDAKNGLLYSEYKKLAEAEDKVIFGGRLGEYKYYDMDQVIAAVLDKCEKELGE